MTLKIKKVTLNGLHPIYNSRLLKPITNILLFYFSVRTYGKDN